MYQAQYLFPREAVYSPWFERVHDNLIAFVDVIALQGMHMDVQLFTKNREDPGDGAQLGTDKIVADKVGRVHQEWNGVKELVRFKFIPDGFSTGGDRVMFRMLDAVWVDEVEANEVE